jgi:putative cardiolipin synthase
MHNKAMIVDNRVALVGGRNLASEYFGYHPANNFRDMEVITWGSAVPALSAGFDSYWNNGWSFPMSEVTELRGDTGGSAAADTEDLETGHRELDRDSLEQAWQELAASASPGTAAVLLDAPPSADPAGSAGAPVQVGRQLLAAIDRAEHDIWLVSAYLIPTPALEAAIARAEARGVEVRILTNSISSNNHLSAHSAYRNHMRELLSAGAELHEVRADAEDRHRYIAPPVADKGLGLHAKLLLLDSHSSFVGTANLDPRSLHINTEMGLLIESPALNSELRKRLESDFAPRNAWRVQLEEDGRISWSSDSETLYRQPTHSHMRRLEDWVMSLLPIESEM